MSTPKDGHQVSEFSHELTPEILPRITQLVMDNPVAYRRCFADIGGSALAGLLLSQFYYWTGVVNRENRERRGWFYKCADEIREETGLSLKEQATARKKLVAKGVLEETRKGIPGILWFRINPINLNKEIARLLLQKDEISGSENNNNGRVSIPLNITPKWIKETEDFTVQKSSKNDKNDPPTPAVVQFSQSAKLESTKRQNLLSQSAKLAKRIGKTITETTAENKTTTTTSNAREKISPASSSSNNDNGFSGEDLSPSDGKLPIDIFAQLLIDVVKTQLEESGMPSVYPKPQATWLRAKGLKLYAKYKHPDPADIAEILLCDWITKCEGEAGCRF